MTSEIDKYLNKVKSQIISGAIQCLEENESVILLLGCEEVLIEKEGKIFKSRGKLFKDATKAVTSSIHYFRNKKMFFEGHKEIQK